MSYSRYSQAPFLRYIKSSADGFSPVIISLGQEGLTVVRTKPGSTRVGLGTRSTPATTATVPIEAQIAHHRADGVTVGRWPPVGSGEMPRSRAERSADTIGRIFTVSFSSKVRNGTRNIRMRDAARQEPDSPTGRR